MSHQELLIFASWIYYDFRNLCCICWIWVKSSQVMKKSILKASAIVFFLQKWRFRFLLKKREAGDQGNPLHFFSIYLSIEVIYPFNKGVMKICFLSYTFYISSEPQKMPTTIRDTKQATHVTMCHLPKCFETAVFGRFRDRMWLAQVIGRLFQWYSMGYCIYILDVYL